MVQLFMLPEGTSRGRRAGGSRRNVGARLFCSPGPLTIGPHFTHARPPPCATQYTDNPNGRSTPCPTNHASAASIPANNPAVTPGTFADCFSEACRAAPIRCRSTLGNRDSAASGNNPVTK